MRISHAARTAPRPGGRDRSQVGETLIEVLVAITLMGVGFTAIIGGIYSSVRIAEVNQRYTKASILVQAYAELVLQPAKDNVPSLYVPCATPYVSDSDQGEYPLYIGSLNGFTASSNWTYRIVKIQYFNGFVESAGVRTAKWDLSLSGCKALSQYNVYPPGDVPRDNGMQRITIEVSNNDPDRPVSDALVIVKRDRRCPVQFSNADRGPC